MTSREQFEQKIQHEYGEDYLAVNDDGDYINWITSDLWEYWVASRAAIEIEAQAPLTTRDALNAGYSADYATGVERGIREMEQAIEQAGLKVKR